jgi:chromosome partitioning protein
VLTVNALTTVTEVLVPVEPSLFSLAGLGTLQSAVDDVRRYLGNAGLHIAGLVLVRTRNDNVSRDVEELLRRTYGPLVYAATVPQNIRVEEAHGRFQSVLDYAPRSVGARAYLSLVREMIHGTPISAAGKIINAFGGRKPRFFEDSARLDPRFVDCFPGRKRPL